MITKIDGYKSNYDALFSSATLALGRTIDSLEAYFMALPELIDIIPPSDNDINDDGVRVYDGLTYTILPLQEPIIPVDNNTRIIDIKDKVKTVAVAGDQGAEILYFLVDRFFDAQDLAATGIKAVIDWKNSGNKEEGTDPAYSTVIDIPNYLVNKDDELSGHKILIGWALGGEAVAAAGTLEFALRFYQTATIGNKEEIIFSLATQPAKITVSKSIDVSEAPIEDTVNNLVKNRIRNMLSPGVPGLVGTPEFYWNLDTIALNLDIDDDAEIDTNMGEESLYQVTDYNNDEINVYVDLVDGKYVATAAAIDDNSTAKMEYEWKKYQNGEWIGLTDGVQLEAYRLIASEDKKENVSYYKKEDDFYVPLTSSDPEDTPIYEKYTFLEITEIGKYKVRAIVSTSNSRAYKESKILSIPYPQVPNIENENQQTSVTFGDNGMANITAKLVTNEEKPYDTSNKASYKWYKAQGNKDYRKQEYTDIVFNTEEETDTNGATLETSEQNWYKAIAVHTRNGESKESEPTYFRVTTRPILPTTFKQNTSNNMISINNNLEIKIPYNDTDYDEYSLKLYKRITSLGITENVEYSADPTNFTIDYNTSNPDDYVMIVDLDSVANEDTRGTYKIELIMTYNGEVAKKDLQNSDGSIFEFTIVQ